MIKLIKVTGESLSPFYQTGDYVIVSRCHLFSGPINRGDVIVFNHPTLGRMIKKVASKDDSSQQYFVNGHHPQSIDSQKIGPVSRQDLVGKVLFHIKQGD